MPRLILLGFFVLLTSDISSAANCPDAGVVVVASVFTTLAVVLIVLGVLGFLLWKRRKDISKPEKHKLKNGESVPSSPENTFAYSNSAFEKDLEAGEGIDGYVPKGDKNENQRLNEADRDLAKKTWSSLPGSNINYVRQRKSSLGSLDRSSYGNGFMLDSSVEVHLTSQDFIGLGFNIAGSMRDGIFVSQVHNRGPANESGKFKVGDRIMSVTVSFENMVYEDALTILSYASPYPVKVTLQKEPQLPKNRKLSDVRTNLNHPLYRSHSIENLKSYSHDNNFHPRRAASEMRYDKKNSPSNKNIYRGGSESSIIEEGNGNAALNFDNDDVFNTTPSPSKVNAIVHNESPKSNIDDVDSTIPNSTLDINIDKLGSETENRAPDHEFTDPFENLTEQDKLDVLRLTYADPTAVPFEAQQQSSSQVEQRSAPVKPERKKKSSSSTPSNSGDFSSLVGMATVVNETQQQDVLPPPLEAPPPVPTDELNTTLEEETIQPEVKSRNINISSEKIQFESIEPINLDSSVISVDKTIVGDESFEEFTDNDKTLVASTPQIKRSESSSSSSSSDDSVEEETFTATQIEKESRLPRNSYVFDEGQSNKVVSSLKSESNMLTNDQVGDSDEKESENMIKVPEVDDDFEKDLPSLDMNLNFDTDSVLFKESFPSRNEKENLNGISYDISVTELDAMGKKAFDEELQKNESLNKNSGIAFEIRDDFTTGETRITNRVHRTSSYDVRLLNSSERVIENEISSQRPTSFKREISGTDGKEVGLDWSGKRLVRSGSFSEIPQDDSVNDWTEDKTLQDDSLIEEHIKEDSKSPVMKQLTRATLVTSNSNPGNDNYSDDSDTRCASLSSNDTSDDNQEDGRSYDRRTNNDDDGLGSSPEDIPKKIMEYSNDFIKPVENHNEIEQTSTITLDIGEDDEEC
ncbi:hypothetical protein ACF0H5_002152 [Mactra antiquata]